MARMHRLKAVIVFHHAQIYSGQFDISPSYIGRFFLELAYTLLLIWFIRGFFGWSKYGSLVAQFSTLTHICGFDLVWKFPFAHLHALNLMHVGKVFNDERKCVGTLQ